jgi:anti-anti-sigma regulatory factor
VASIHRSNVVGTHIAGSPRADLVDDAPPRVVARRDCRKRGGMSPSVVEPTDGHVVAMSGAVNPGMVIALHRTISAAVDAGHRVIVIDLSAVTFLGPQTAGLFCGALRRLERRGAALEILGGPQPFQRMLVTGGGSSRVTQRAERDRQRSLEVIAAFGDHLSTAEMGDTPTGKVVGAAVPALVTGDRSVRGA